MTEIGESAAVIAEEQQQEDHWVKVEYTYSNGLPVEGYFYATDGDGIDWAGKLNDKGQVCLSGLPPGNVSVELIPGDEEKELTNIRKAIQQALDGIVEAEKQEAETKEAGYQKYGPAGYHVAVAKGLWDGAVGLVTFAWDTVKTAAEIAQYLSPAEKLSNFLNATYKSYKSGSLTEADWRESLIKNYQEEEFKDLAELLGFDVRTLNEQKIEEIKLLITEAYEVTAFILEDSECSDLFTQFAKDYAAAQSSYEWAEFAGGGIFEIVLTALLLAFTAGIGNVAQAASKVRHVSKLKNLGTLIRKLGKLLKRKKLKKKVSSGVDSEKKVTVDLPDDVKLTAKTERGKQGQGDSATMQDENVVPDNIHKSSRGSNEGSWTVNSEGRPVSVQATLREDFGSTKRSSAERTLQRDIGKQGVVGDEGGHFIGHRFLGDQGLKNLFPQNFNLNRGAYRSMENHFADLTKQGLEVNVKGTLYPPGAIRPEKMNIQYQVFDPSLNKIIESSSFKFTNQAGQKFSKP